MSDERRRWVPPVGIPQRPKLYSYRVAGNVRVPLVSLNRYPRQVIGAGVRWPGHRILAVQWSRPARWWAKFDAEATR